jgi:hypothetical protein
MLDQDRDHDHVAALFLWIGSTQRGRIALLGVSCRVFSGVLESVLREISNPHRSAGSLDGEASLLVSIHRCSWRHCTTHSFVPFLSEVSDEAHMELGFVPRAPG